MINSKNDFLTTKETPTSEQGSIATVNQENLTFNKYLSLYCLCKTAPTSIKSDPIKASSTCKLDLAPLWKNASIDMKKSSIKNY